MTALIESDPNVASLTAPLATELELADQGKSGQRRLLGQELLGADLISPDELDAALKTQAEKGIRLGEALLEMGFITEEELLPHIEAHLAIPAIRLREGLIDTEAVAIIPRSVSEALQVLPLLKVRDTLTVAMADPQDLIQIDRLEELTGLKVRPVFASAKSLSRMIERAYENDFEIDRVTADLDEDAIALQEDKLDVDLASVQELVEGSPVINLVNYVILQAIRKGASDIHIEPGRKYSAVRFRIDGQLVEMLRPRLDIYPALVSRVKVMAKLDIAEQRIPQDGRCQVIVDKREVDLRISTLPTILGEKVVMRVLDKRKLTFDLDQLGLPVDTLSDVKTMLRRPYGMVLVTGPTGSGKTTTLYSALELIKSVHSNVITVEDPVEYQLELINQVQVDNSRSVGFANILRSILRQDPDVIMVGEIRDAETARVAVQAALTGHLVLSTLHTNDCAGAVTRMVDMGVEPFKLAAALVGIISQRLVRTICPKCRSNHYPSSEYLDALHYQGDRRRSFSRGEGCRDCFDTGFKGRIGIYEVMAADTRLREMISNDAGLEAIRNWFTRGGRRTLLESGLLAAENEQTSLEEVARVALFE